MHYGIGMIVKVGILWGEVLVEQCIYIYIFNIYLFFIYNLYTNYIKLNFYKKLSWSNDDLRIYLLGIT